MLFVLLCLVLGIVSGFLLRKKKKIITLSERLTMWFVYILLFLLGIPIGQNRELFSRFDEIGLNAFLLTLAAVAGTIFLSYLLFHLFFKKRLHER